MKNTRRKTLKRDLNILLSMKGEIKMGTSCVSSKKLYSRKTKHKGSKND